MKFRTLAGQEGWLREVDVELRPSSPSRQEAQGTVGVHADRDTEVAASATANVGSGTNDSAAAQATIAAQATHIAVLETQQADADATATVLASVAANSVLDPNQRSITVQTDLNGMISQNPDELARVRRQYETLLSRFPLGCRAGFELISGNAPDLETGIALADEAEKLLREVRPDIFTDDTGGQNFAQPNTRPFGLVTIDIFFYLGCEPTG